MVVHHSPTEPLAFNVRISKSRAGAGMPPEIIRQRPSPQASAADSQPRGHPNAAGKAGRSPRTSTAREGSGTNSGWCTPKWPPVAMRCMRVCDPEGKRRMADLLCLDLQTTPQILQSVVRRGSVAVTDEEARAYLAVETQRPWADRAMARTMPLRMALCFTVAVLTLPWSYDGQLPVPATAWYRTVEPPFATCMALVHQYRWRARLVVNSTAA
jgi:hypothetical protein